MKKDLRELLEGSSLRSQIYNTLSRQKLSNMGKLLRHTLHVHPRYNHLKSQEHTHKTEMSSPSLKHQHSHCKFSQSFNSPSAQRAYKSNSKPKEHKLQRTQQTVINNKFPTHKNKSKSQILPHSKAPSQQASKLKQKLKSNSDKKVKTTQTQNSSFKSRGTANLESILEQSSSEEQLGTPQHKTTQPPLTHSRTKKKQKQHTHPLTDSLKRKLRRSFKSPQIFQKLLRSQAVTLSYRILKQRLIEIQIYTLQHIPTLKIALDKGNLECQNIQEEYNNTPPNTLLALFSAVRHLDIDHPTLFPKIELEIQLNETQKIQRSLTLPYTWLHFAEEKLPSLKHSKIKTKLCLCNLPISSTNLHILSEVFRTWLKKGFKGHRQFETGFSYEDHQFTLKLIQQESQRFTVQLEGKGQNRLTSMIQFLQHLIC